MPQKTPPVNDHYVSLAYAAERLGISRQSARRLVSNGYLKASRVGPRTIRIDPADIDRLLRPIPAATAAE